MTSKSPPVQAPPPPPSVTVIFASYAVLGAALSFAFGRDPSGPLLPPADALVDEVAPTAIVVCLFLVSYSLLDVMTVGVLKGKHGWGARSYPAVAALPPEEVYLAQRAQTNQVEQLPGYLVGSFSFALLVNGRAGAALSLAWALLRRAYASRYRASAGTPLARSGIVRYTVPAYFALNSMLMGTAVQCARALAAHGR